MSLHYSRGSRPWVSCGDYCMVMDKHNEPTKPLTAMFELSTGEVVVYRKTNAEAWMQGDPMDVIQ